MCTCATDLARGLSQRPHRDRGRLGVFIARKRVAVDAGGVDLAPVPVRTTWHGRGKHNWGWSETVLHCMCVCARVCACVWLGGAYIHTCARAHMCTHHTHMHVRVALRCANASPGGISIHRMYAPHFLILVTWNPCGRIVDRCTFGPVYSLAERSCHALPPALLARHPCFDVSRPAAQENKISRGFSVMWLKALLFS